MADGVGVDELYYDEVEDDAEPRANADYDDTVGECDDYEGSGQWEWTR